MPIVWNEYGSGGYFSLQDKPSFRSSDMGPRYHVTTSSNYPRPLFGRATYAPATIETYTSPSLTEKPKVDAYIYTANATLADAAAEYNRAWVGQNHLNYSIAAGVGALVLLGGLFLLVRRSARRTVEAWVRDEVNTIGSEFAPEMQSLPEPLNLNQTTAVIRMIAALEIARQIWKPLPNPLWLWHRVFAPF
jgi:hypothetical protein